MVLDFRVWSRGESADFFFFFFLTTVNLVGSQ